MLYYYITSPLKKQGVQRIFFTLRKNLRAPAAVFAIAPEKSEAAPESGTAEALWFTVQLCLLRRTDGTCICAGAALETCVRINLILAVALCDCADRTCICTCTALDASITDSVCHNCYLL